MTIPTFVQPRDLGDEYRKIFMATIVATRLIAVIYIIGGFYLLRGGKWLYDFAFKETPEDFDDIREKFTLFVKLFGIFLIISYFPDLLLTVSNYFVYSNSPSVFNLTQEKQFVYLNAASSIWGVFFGAYLLKSGRFIVNLGLKSVSKKTTKSNDQA